MKCLISWWSFLLRRFAGPLQPYPLAPRKEWIVKPVSQKKILFDLTAGQKQAFSTLEEILLSKRSFNGLVQLMPEFSSISLCSKCLGPCTEKSSRRVPCFLRKKVFQCEGNLQTIIQTTCLTHTVSLRNLYYFSGIFENKLLTWSSSSVEFTTEFTSFKFVSFGSGKKSTAE